MKRHTEGCIGAYIRETKLNRRTHSMILSAGLRLNELRIFSIWVSLVRSSTRFSDRATGRIDNGRGLRRAQISWLSHEIPHVNMVNPVPYFTVM